MALTKISRSLLDTGISDSSDATAITIDSSENVGLGARLSVGTTTVGGGNTKIVATGGTDNYLQLVSNTGSGGISLGNAGANLLIYTHTGALGSESFTERMRITSDGNVGVGTTDTNSHRMAIDSGSGTSLGLMHKSSNAFTLMTFKASGTSQDIRLGAVGNDMIFQTNGTERMRIDSAGRFGFSGTYPPTSAQFMRIEEEFTSNRIVRMANRDNSGNSNTFEVGHADNNEGAHVIIAYHGNNTSGASGDPYNDAILSLQVNGNMGIDGTLSEGSDRRLKKDIANSTYGLAAINQLIPRTYKHRDVSKEMIGTQIGFIADEVESVIPEIVSKFGLKADGSTLSKSITGYGDEAGTEETFDNVKTLNYERLVVVLTKALQEADDKIEALTARITTLEGE